ncbi:hypothetical protein [Mycolicibacterium peregrinum]|uniref:Uncharacterized protein n=1 Tax=Mycolicibacterium peregrinum TaxID=43304 RepID=A0A1A0VQP8_MYCPR|nr:hypothetical protein [Mycolicibacterium peregrinum]OBB85548.1 hypothetical protein A5779_03895 [Mycolicibacterium peregrinum]
MTSLHGGRPAPYITVIDRDDLDKRMADAPHIESYVHRTTNSELERLAKIYNQEKAAVLGGVTDVLTQVRDLGSVVNTLDPEWAIGFASAPGGSTSSVMVAPRRPGAAIHNPIRMAVGVDELDPELSRQLLRSIGYAVPGTVIMPANVIRSVHISGGPFVAGEYPPGEVHLVTPSGAGGRGKTVELRAFQRDNTDVQIFEGTVINHSLPGPAGGTIEAAFCDGRLTLRMLLPYTVGPAHEVFGPPGVGLSYDFAATRSTSGTRKAPLAAFSICWKRPRRLRGTSITPSAIPTLITRARASRRRNAQHGPSSSPGRRTWSKSPGPDTQPGLPCCGQF